MRMSGMNWKILAAAAALMMVTACSDEPKQTGGAGAGATAAAPAPAPKSKVVPGSAEDFKVNVGDTAYFDFDKSNVRADAASVLQKQAAWLKTYPKVTITIEGHCDERGTREYNLALGERRANSSKEYLVSQGIDASRISTISYGKERPVCTVSDEGCWQQNRRSLTTIQTGAAS